VEWNPLNKKEVTAITVDMIAGKVSKVPKEQKGQQKIKARISASHIHYIHCGLRDPVSFSESPLTTLDWYVALIAAQASEAAYGQPPELLRKPHLGNFRGNVQHINSDKVVLPPLDSLQKECLSRIEDLCSYLQSTSSTANCFLDNKDSDLQAWYCELEKPLSAVLAAKVIPSDSAASRVAAAVLDLPQAEEVRPQIILAFRGTKGLQDVGSDASALKVPLTWPGEDEPASTCSSLPSRLILLASAAGAAVLALRGSPVLGAAVLGATGLALYLSSSAGGATAPEGGRKMAEAYRGVTAEDIRALAAQGSSGAQTRLAKACASLLEGGGADFAPLLAQAAAHKGFLRMYHSARDDLLALLADPRHAGPDGRFRPKLLVCGHSMGGALARLCALDLVVAGRVPAAQVSLVTFGSAPPGNRALAKLTDLLHLHRDLHFVNDHDPVPTTLLSLSEGGVIPAAASAALLRGSFSFSGCKVRFAAGEGAAYEPCQERRPLAAAAGLLRQLAGLLFPRGDTLGDHATAHYIRKVAACALAAGVGVESSFAGSTTLGPPPAWAQRLLLAGGPAPAPAPAPAK
jgi:hypothetical protein